MDVGPQRGPLADQAAEDSGVGSPEPGDGGRHIHPMDLAELQASGRFVRDSRVGGMFHPGQVPFREDSPRESIHISVGQDNHVSVHIDRFSPLAKRKPGKRRGYSVHRVVLHNVGIVMDYITLVVHRRFGAQRCDLVCERICDDDHDECDTSTTVGIPASILEVSDTLSPIMGDAADREPEGSGGIVALPPRDQPS